MRVCPSIVWVAVWCVPAAAQAPGPKDGPSSERVAALVQRLAARYLTDRQEAEAVLLKLGAEAEPALLRALGQEDFRIRAAACQLLALLKSEAAIPRIVDLLDDAEPSVQEAAVSALLQVGSAGTAHVEKARREGRVPAQALETLHRSFQRAVEERLNACITPPVRVGEPRGARYVFGCGFYKGQFRDVLALGDAAVPILLKLFTTSPQDYEFVYPFDGRSEEAPPFVEKRKELIRHLAGEALAETNDRAAIPALKQYVEFLGEIDPMSEHGAPMDHYETAAFALMKLGEPSAFIKLKEAILKAAEARIDASGALQVKPCAGAEQRAGQILALARLASLQIKDYETAAAEQTYVRLVESLQREIAQAEGPPGVLALRWKDMLSNAHYNLACVYALMNKKPESLRSLAQAIETGYRNVYWLQRDGDLDAIRGESEYREMVSRLERERKQHETVPRPRPEG